MRDCEICRGRGTVRLPIYRRITSPGPAAVSTPSEAPFRNYPCPECSDTITPERIFIVRQDSLVDSSIRSDDFTSHARRSMAAGLVHEALENGLIEFTRGPENWADMTKPMRATIGVVSPRHVTTLEQRVAAHQDQLAREILSEATAAIQVWNSAYTGAEGLISKAQAIKGAQEAVARVLKRRHQTPERL